MNELAPAIDDVRRLQQRLQEWLVRTPVVRCRALEDRQPDGLEIHAKMEFLQQTGTFKPRGALSVILQLDEEQLKAGVTAVSAGNHAIATAFAAQAVGTSAKVVMTKTASPVRMEACRSYGAEVVLADDVHVAFKMADTIREQEQRFFVHPFEGQEVVTGTATVGLEICEQIGEFDVAIIPIGGGGLCAGISSAIKQLNPACKVIGVEPEGADSMHRSFASGKPESIEKVLTIADSLGAPFAMPYSFNVCRQNVDELVMIDDDQIRDAMRMLFTDMKIAVEPACAATTAALFGPLRGRYAGKKVVLVLCGSNIDWETYATHARLTKC
ncbi:MAG: threonine/serine dehydratase [Gammaproteobacteria bacterium]|nr:MAG: threonine/serine dehydratase [Gammaproteobacteria bacterium]RLA32841.1 MAG: threonine/serine dehydratase [Gammaproteobacteria bacterium]